LAAASALAGSCPDLVAVALGARIDVDAAVVDRDGRLGLARIAFGAGDLFLAAGEQFVLQDLPATSIRAANRKNFHHDSCVTQVATASNAWYSRDRVLEKVCWVERRVCMELFLIKR
jgi:hypothetical protein